MKYIIYLLFFQTILFSQVKSIYAPVEKQMRLIPEQQTKSVQEIANYIQSNFKGEELQIKAAYFYVISTISYDVTYNFSTELFSSDEDFVTKTITTKKGVCIHYAKLFKAIISQLGYHCEIVTGYTKQNNQIGKLSHAWCAIKMKDNNWYVFDPTWDSGYVKDEKYFRNLNSNYYKKTFWCQGFQNYTAKFSSQLGREILSPVLYIAVGAFLQYSDFALSTLQYDLLNNVPYNLRSDPVFRDRNALMTLATRHYNDKLTSLSLPTKRSRGASARAFTQIQKNAEGTYESLGLSYRSEKYKGIDGAVIEIVKENVEKKINMIFFKNS